MNMQDLSGYVPQNIKKRLVTLLFFVLCAVLVVACGGGTQNGGEDNVTEDNGTEVTQTPPGETDDNEDDSVAQQGQQNETPSDAVLTDEIVTEDNIAQFVTLGEYRGIEFTRIGFELTDEDVYLHIINRFMQPAMTEVTDRAVMNGDVVRIDFAGYHNGELFDGGTAHGFDLTIGSGMFIPGFEEQIIGHNIGDEFDIYISFPEDYFAEHLAGEDVIFRINIHAIMTEVTPELTDEWIQEHFEFDSVEEYVQMVREQMEEEWSHSAMQQERGQVWEQILDGATIHMYPEDEIDSRLESAMLQFEFYALMNGMTLEDLIMAAIGIPLDEFIDLEVRPSIMDEVSQDLVVRAIAAQEGITISDEQFREGVDNFVENFGFENAEEFIETHGEDVIRVALLAERILDLVMEHAIPIYVE